MYTAADISIVIPTYGREEVLVATVASLLDLEAPAGEVILVDQTPEHSPETERALQEWDRLRVIRWLRHSPPSIPGAMNAGLLAARGGLVLFLDDDIIPGRTLVATHATAFSECSTAGAVCIAGQVLQPGEEPIDPASWKKGWFPFHSTARQWIADVMAGNLCVDRRRFIALGGFDENFVGAAYRFESEFARRVLRSGCKIFFEPGASIRHLRAERGGTRAYGGQLTTWKPHHAVGKYYYGFRGGVASMLSTLALQPLRAVRTRYHLHRPWRMVPTLIGEALAILWAARLCWQGPRLIRAGQTTCGDRRDER